MQRYLAYLHEKLDPIYPISEVGSFSRLLLSKLAGMSSVQIYSDKDRNFPEHTLIKLMDAINRLSRMEPIQYILGETEFCNFLFHVRPGVLIPRPETEELVERIALDCQDHGKCKQILDVGTGSGCIAISLAKLLPMSNVTAWDISPEALVIAIDNAARNKVNVCFEQKDVLNFKLESQHRATLDILVSNPPYVRQSEADDMGANVLEHEPHVALFVENSDALIFYRIISSLATEMLKPGGALYFEINSNLGKETLETVNAFNFKKVDLFQDLSGKDRMIRAIR